MKLREIPCPTPGCKAYYTSNNVAVIVGQEPCGPGGAIRWHISVSHTRRYPTWDEIRDLRYQLIPNDVVMVMFLPPQEEYVNVHQYCFHLFEIEKGELPIIYQP